MSSLPARTGRHRQRYKDQFRLVAGCIPFRLEKNVEDRSCNLEDRLLVLMISSPNRDDLVFPKGGWEDDETMKEAACREALEEAGVKGILSLNIEEAFKFCRYDWMREALKKLLMALSEDRANGMKEELVELPLMPVPDAGAERPMLSPGCFGKPSGVQHLDESCNKCIVLG